MDTEAGDSRRGMSAQISGIATEEGVSIEMVEELYRRELERLGIGARIVDFLPVLAVNNLKRQLRDRRQKKRSGAPAMSS